MRDYVARNDIFFNAQTKTDAIFFQIAFKLASGCHMKFQRLVIHFEICGILFFVFFAGVCVFGLALSYFFFLSIQQSFFNNIFPICWLVSLFSIEIDAKQQYIDKE